MVEPKMASTSSNFRAYPQAIEKYEDVVSDPKLFMGTLEKLHGYMGTKFMIPIIGGKELDLHRLFREVTSRGGIEKIQRDRRWKEVTAVFNFPSTATNASFVLRKYYYSLLNHYEQIYYFKAGGFSPVSGAENLQSPRVEPSKSSPPELQGIVLPQTPRPETELPGAKTQAQLSSGASVVGVIDGKFESGYLVTVTIGSEKLKGVLYQAPQNQTQFVSSNRTENPNPNANVSSGGPVVHRRKRRKKSEIKRRDPAHPKPNRSGYNFFFAEQHARLKPLHPGKDREISRMIGELWNKLTETERVVYQEKAVKDKERYRIEMEGYRERIKTGQVISDAVPLRQRFPEQNVSVVVEPTVPKTIESTEADLEEELEEEEGEEVEEEEDDSPETLDNESVSSGSEEDDETAEIQTEDGSKKRKATEEPKHT